MEMIYSKALPGKLLHVIKRLSDIESQKLLREDIIPEDNFLQCSSLRLKAERTFKPHKHIFKDRHHPRMIAQESWVVIRGSVLCTLYDLDDTIIANCILYAGDASFTLYGGHTYLILEDDTIVYEYKTGPYEGQEFDKTFI